MLLAWMRALHPGKAGVVAVRGPRKIWGAPGSGVAALDGAPDASGWAYRLAKVVTTVAEEPSEARPHGTPNHLGELFCRNRAQ